LLGFKDEINVRFKEKDFVDYYKELGLQKNPPELTAPE
jgi:hypothetical protein